MAKKIIESRKFAHDFSEEIIRTPGTNYGINLDRKSKMLYVWDMKKDLQNKTVDMKLIFSRNKEFFQPKYSWFSYGQKQSIFFGHVYSSTVATKSSTLEEIKLVIQSEDHKFYAIIYLNVENKSEVSLVRDRGSRGEGNI